MLGVVNGVHRLNTEFPESILPVSWLKVAQDVDDQIGVITVVVTLPLNMFQGVLCRYSE
jgi:hypothetical protein